MSNANFSILVDFAAGGLVLASVLIVWRRDLRAIVRLLAWQGAALAAIPLLRGIRDNDRALIAVGIAVLALRALVLPWLLARAVGAEAAAQREATPLVNTASSLLITAGLTLTAFAITQPVVNLEPGVTINAVPAAFAVVLIALFVMTTRLHAVSQAAGFLMLDNGIAATAFLLTAGVPLIVELGASLDVLFAVIVIGVLTGRCAAFSAMPTWTSCGSCGIDDRFAACRDPRTARRVNRLLDHRVATHDGDAHRAVRHDGAGLRCGDGVLDGVGGAVRAGRSAARRCADGGHARRHRDRRHTGHRGEHRLHRHRAGTRAYRRT